MHLHGQLVCLASGRCRYDEGNCDRCKVSERVLELAPGPKLPEGLGLSNLSTALMRSKYVAPGC